jgi:hypothetical protein
MEDAAVIPRFYRIPLWMVAADGLDCASFRLPAHFFAVYETMLATAAPRSLATARSGCTPHSSRTCARLRTACEAAASRN